MSRGEADWLALREPQDHAARSRELAQLFAASATPGARVVDLASGTGSNYRYLRPFFPADSAWRLVDRDRQFLAAAEGRSIGANLSTERLDLFDALDSLVLEPGDLLTMSAFLDLASASWIDRFVEHCCDHTLLVAMSADGRLAWSPRETEDEILRAGYQRRQMRDRGFGPSLGAEAAQHLALRLEEKGHRVQVADSAWSLGPGDEKLLGTLVDAFAQPEFDEASQSERRDWAARRRSQLDAGALCLQLGHSDLLSIPVDLPA